MAPFVADDRLKDFMTGSDELVQQVGQTLPTLEDCSGPEVRNRIVRAMHATSRACSFFASEKLVGLTRHARNPLNQWRTGELATARTINDIHIALAVEGLIGQESTVVKPLSALLRDSTHAAGTMITGDGRERLVLDPNILIRAVLRHTRFTRGYL